MSTVPDLETLAADHRIVGRRRELRAMLACLATGRNVLLQGPVGVGKTAVARAVSEGLGRGFVRVDGDGRYTEGKLVGHFDPPGVLARGYVEDLFVPGPLVRAMQGGHVLFVNELNRMPEGVQNVLLPALDEGLVHVPHLGTVTAAKGFAVVATQNPAEFVAAGHLSEALLDRFELVELGYQEQAEERGIVAQEVRCAPSDEIMDQALALVRATRRDPRIRRGASVRAAVAIADLATALDGDLHAAAALALPTRIELGDEQDEDFLQVLRDLEKKNAEATDPTLTLPLDLETQEPSGSEDAATPHPRSFSAAAATPGSIDELPEDWDAATNYHRLKRVLPRHLRQEVRERAVEAILRRARSLLRHASRPLVPIQDRFPAEGELDLDATLEQPRPWQPKDIVVKRIEPRQADVVAVLDMSLSMTGEKVALVALATVILRLKLDHLAVVAFDTVSHRLVGVGEQVAPRELVRRVLEVPAQGYTNISAGLAAAGAELRRSRRKERLAVLMSDGIANVGHNPVREAHKLPRLHVIQVGLEEPQGTRACRKMVAAGRGRLYRAHSYEVLPDVVKRLVRECFRG